MSPCENKAGSKKQKKHHHANTAATGATTGQKHTVRLSVHHWRRCLSGGDHKVVSLHYGHSRPAEGSVPTATSRAMMKDRGPLGFLALLSQPTQVARKGSTSWAFIGNYTEGGGRLIFLFFIFFKGYLDRLYLQQQGGDIFYGWIVNFKTMQPLNMESVSHCVLTVRHQPSLHRHTAIMQCSVELVEKKNCPIIGNI